MSRELLKAGDFIAKLRKVGDNGVISRKELK